MDQPWFRGVKVKILPLNLAWPLSLDLANSNLLLVQSIMIVIDSFKNSCIMYWLWWQCPGHTISPIQGLGCITLNPKTTSIWLIQSQEKSESSRRAKCHLSEALWNNCTPRYWRQKWGRKDVKLEDVEITGDTLSNRLRLWMLSRQWESLLMMQQVSSYCKHHDKCCSVLYQGMYPLPYCDLRCASLDIMMKA